MNSKITCEFLVNGNWIESDTLLKNTDAIRITVKYLNREKTKYVSKMNVNLSVAKRVTEGKMETGKLVEVDGALYAIPSRLGKFDKVYKDRESMINDFKIVLNSLKGSLFVDTVDHTSRKYL